VKPPTAVLGESTDAQLSLRSLEQVWQEGRDRDRQLLEPRLREFLAKHPQDPQSRQVMLWLGWISLAKQDFGEALVLADQANADGQGAVSDAARVLRAAIHTRRGEPEQALRLLEPLSGMLVDPIDRDDWAREIVRATLKLQHHDDALKWALVWRLECSEDRRATVEREITKLLDRVSRASLERLWVQLQIALQLPASIPGRKQARAWMRGAVTERLARYAIHNQDASLAQRLLEDRSVSLQRNASLKRLARIAARAETENQSVGRKIGIVLDLDDPLQRRRSSEVVTGILHTLEVSGTNRVQLLTREASRADPNGYDDAINDLYNEGVAAIIGGFEPASATEMVIKARPRGVAVITLAPLEPAERDERTYFVDTSDTRARDVWYQHVGAKGDRVIEVTDPDPFCTQVSTGPLESWQSARIERVYLASDSPCAEKFAYAATRFSRLPEIWLGPKALASWGAWQSIPIAGFVTFEPMAMADQGDSTLARWSKRFSRVPHYYEALGHDTTVLIVAALDAVPNLASSGASARSEMLSRVSQELARARAPLWSSRDRGFTTEHGLVPSFVVRVGRPETSAAPVQENDERPE